MAGFIAAQMIKFDIRQKQIWSHRIKKIEATILFNNPESRDNQYLLVYHRFYSSLGFLYQVRTLLEHSFLGLIAVLIIKFGTRQKETLSHTIEKTKANILFSNPESRHDQQSYAYHRFCSQLSFVSPLDYYRTQFHRQCCSSDSKV